MLCNYVNVAKISLKILVIPNGCTARNGLDKIYCPGRFHHHVAGSLLAIGFLFDAQVISVDSTLPGGVESFMQYRAAGTNMSFRLANA